MSRTVRALLEKIQAGTPHRCSWDTYDAVVKAGLAQYVAGSGWQLTDLGREAIRAAESAA